MDLLMRVNHTGAVISIRRKPVQLGPGQCWTSLSKLANDWGWSRVTVKRFLDTLKSEKMVTLDVTQNGTLVTIENWELYQGKVKTKSTTDCTTDYTTDYTTRFTQTRMIKNVKEGEEEKNARKRATPSPRRKPKTFSEYVEMEEQNGQDTDSTDN